MNPNKLLIFTLILFLAGCVSRSAIQHTPGSADDKAKKLIVFLDGTANDEGSYTNIAKLNNLVNLQQRNDIRTAYIKGVGTDGKFIGMAMGWGIGHDVREAYLFLSNNYKHDRGDEIYIFGFSRGAYAARILSSLINVAGVQNLSDIDKEYRYQHVRKIYNAFKGKKSNAERRSDVAKVIGHQPMSNKVEFLGLWDTVEALGVPDYKENGELPNERYGDQLCNIKSAAHALSLDDNRARIFTPILLSKPHLTSECKNIDIDEIVDEVWFSGAHADVGGGYLDSYLSGVSLNWMLSKIEKYNITPSGSKVYSNHLDKTHDPESGIWGLVYRERSRDLYSYAKFNTYNNGKLKLHTSVIDRLRKKLPNDHEFKWMDSKYKKCFTQNDDGLFYIAETNCFTIEN